MDSKNGSDRSYVIKVMKPMLGDLKTQMDQSNKNNTVQ